MWHDWSRNGYSYWPNAFFRWQYCDSWGPDHFWPCLLGTSSFVSHFLFSRRTSVRQIWKKINQNLLIMFLLKINIIDMPKRFILDKIWSILRNDKLRTQNKENVLKQFDWTFHKAKKPQYFLRNQASWNVQTKRYKK